jgi:KDO2-lipid IV(A) lauroyltransferase
VSALIFGLMWILHFLPARFVARIGEAAGTVAFWAIRERREVTRINLQKCFPDMPAGERERLARAHFRAFVRAFLERAILWWAPRARIERLVRIEGLERLHSFKGSPVVLLAPHFVGLDAGFTRLACETDLVFMFANQKDPRFGALLRHGRNRFGRQVLVSRQEGIAPVLRAMAAGMPNYYMPDLDNGAKHAVFVPFFGVPAATVTGLSFIARKTGAAVLPCIARMLPGEGYVLRIEPAWEDFPSQDPAADTRRMNAFIEERVLAAPEQYFWLHKRFKTRPAGEPRFY